MDLAAAVSYFSPKDSTKLSFRKLIEYAWLEFQRQPIYYLGFTALSLVVPIIISGLFAQFGLAAIPAFLIMLLVNPPLQLGTAAYLHHKHETHTENFLFFFRPFRKELLDMFVFSILTVVALIFITFPALTVQTIMEQNGTIDIDEPAPLSLKIVRIVTLIAILFYAVAMMFAPYYIYFYKLNALKAMKQSYQVIKSSWFWFLGLYLAIGGLVLAGLLGLVVCVMITLPVARIASYYVFARYSGIDQLINQEDTPAISGAA
jgi:hypothetical protein